MALITCPDCGNGVSDKAPSCPKCGCPTSEISKQHQPSSPGIESEEGDGIGRKATGNHARQTSVPSMGQQSSGFLGRLLVGLLVVVPLLLLGIGEPIVGLGISLFLIFHSAKNKKKDIWLYPIKNLGYLIYIGLSTIFASAGIGLYPGNQGIERVVAWLMCLLVFFSGVFFLLHQPFKTKVISLFGLSKKGFQLTFVTVIALTSLVSIPGNLSATRYEIEQAINKKQLAAEQVVQQQKLNLAVEKAGNLIESTNIRGAISSLSQSIKEYPAADNTKAQKLLNDCKNSISPTHALDTLNRMLPQEFKDFQKNGNVPDGKYFSNKVLTANFSGTLRAQLSKSISIRRKADAEAKILAQQAAKSARKANLRGPRPNRSSWDGSVDCVKDYLKYTLKDPDSVKFIGWDSVIPYEHNRQPCWAVRVRYRAKNSFGAYSIAEQIFYIQHNRVVDILDIE